MSSAPPSKRAKTGRNPYHLGRHLVPTVTPLADDGSFDGGSWAQLVRYLAEAGTHGLYVGGSTGEGLHLSLGIRRELTVAAVAEGKKNGLSVMVHVGAPRSADAIELAKHAKASGADAVSAMPPFVGGAAFEDVVSFYTDLALASKPVPVLAYYIPAVTKTELSLDQLQQIAAIPGVMGFKFTGYNLFKMSRLLTRMDPGQVIYNGQDQMVALGLQFGAYGGIGSAYNFLAPMYRNVIDLNASGDWQASVTAQLQINDILETYKSGAGTSKQVATIKQILVFHGVLASGQCAQRIPLDRAEKDALQTLLGSHDLLKPFLTPYSFSD